MPGGRPKKPKPAPKRQAHGSGSVTWDAARQAFRARLPRDLSGKRASRYFDTRAEAEAWLANTQSRASDSFDPSRALGAYLNYWYSLRAPSWGPQTARRYLYEVRALGSLGHVVLDRLRGDHVQGLIAVLLARGVTRRYAYNVVSLLRRALADAVRWKILSDNVAEAVALPRPERQPARAWDVAEVRAVLAAIVGHRFEATYLLILWGGLRIGEVVALRWPDIAADGTVLFDLAEHSNIRGRPIGTTKRDRLRETQLPPSVVARLAELHAAGPAPMAWPARSYDGSPYLYVAQRPDGARWTARTIRDDWVTLVESLADVQPLRPHGGRRSYSTLHMLAGTPLADLSTLLGHSSPATTAASYLGSSVQRRREAAERLNRLVSGE